MRAARVVSAPDVAGKKDKQIAVRLDSELAERIDAYIARKREETGIEFTDAAAVRRLLVAGLDAEEKSTKKRGG